MTVYHVRPGRRAALRAALTGRGFDISGRKVTEVRPDARQCCPTRPGASHDPGCIASPLTRLEMARHEAFEGRSLPEAELP